MQLTPVFIVASVRPSVGKTLLARLLIDFFRGNHRTVQAFDLNTDDFGLLGYQPDCTAAASITDTLDQMALIDRLIVSDAVAKIVDLNHVVFSRFFKMLEEINFIQEACRTSVIPIVLYVPDKDNRSKEGFEMLRERFPRLMLVPVLNGAITSIRNLDGFPAKGSINMPALSPVLKGVIERPAFSFARIISTPNDMFSELYLWTRRVFLQFRELELRLLLEELKPQLEMSADR